MFFPLFLDNWDGGYALNTLSDKMLRLLAYQRLNQLIQEQPATLTPLILNTPNLTPPPENSEIPTFNPLSPISSSIPVSTVRSRAVLIPLSVQESPSIVMPYRNITFGTGLFLVSINVYFHSLLYLSLSKYLGN